MIIPTPDPVTFTDPGPIFVPADFDDFVRSTLLNENSRLFNDDHIHLNQASIGYLWTNVRNRRKMRRVVGEAEIPNFRSGAWQNGRQEFLLTQWFGDVPDFVVTFDAEYWLNEADDVARLALLEHELYHCGQQTDEFGFPKFNQQSGRPMYGIRGHDVEEFIGVVRRYGLGAVDKNVADLVDVAAADPSIARVAIASLCGTCSSGS
jgi:hypothetical protein